MTDTGYNPDDAKPVAMNPLFLIVDDSMQEIVKEIEELAERKLKVVDEALVQFNSHDIRHAQRTLGHVCEILQRTGVFKDIQPDDALIIIAASLLHDVGMGPLGPIEDTAFKEDRLRIRRGEAIRVPPERIDEWREFHHLRALKWIQESRGTVLDKLDVDVRIAVSEIACAHRKIPILHHEFFEKHPKYAFYGAALRLGDQMDITPSRIVNRFENPRESFKIALEGEGPEESDVQLTEWLKVFASKHWKLVIQEETREFVLSSEIWDDELTLRTLSALEELVKDIEETIESTKDVPWLSDSGTKRLLPLRLRVDFRVKGEVEETSHKLGADYNRVWDYLIERLYTSDQKEFIPIREAISNSIDACLLLPAEERKQAVITVEDCGTSILIKDNGIGMTKDIIENHLKVLGSSYYNSSRFAGWLNKMGMKSPSLIGLFGIGVFSYLLVSNAYEIDTKSDDDVSYKIRCSRKFGVTLPGTMTTRGTSVRIPCGHNRRAQRWENSIKLKGLIQYLFPKPEVRMSFMATNGPEEAVGFYLSGSKFRPPKGNSYYEFEDAITSDGLEIGLSLRSDGCNIPSFKTATEKMDFISGINGEFWNGELFPGGMGPILLYSGMRISGINQEDFPITRALFSTASVAEPIRCRGQGIAWIDIKRGRLPVNLTKSEIENPDQLTSANARLETLSRKCLEALFSSLCVDDYIKYRARYQLANDFFSGLALPQEQLGRTRQDAFDLRLFTHALDIYLNQVRNDPFMVENLLNEFFCINCKNNKHSSLGEQIKSSKNQLITFNFSKSGFSSIIDYSNLHLIDTSKKIVLCLPDCHDVFKHVLKYHYSRMGYAVYMPEMIHPILGRNTPRNVDEIEREYLLGIPSRPRYDTIVLHEDTKEKLLAVYSKLIVLGGKSIAGSDILTLMIDSLMNDYPRHLRPFAGERYSSFINNLGGLYGLRAEEELFLGSFLTSSYSRKRQDRICSAAERLLDYFAQ